MNKLIKIVGLSILMMGSALQAMDSGKADLNSQLRDAALEGNKQLVETLIKSGANVNALDIHGRTALRSAVFHGHYEICKLLIDKGVDVNALNIKFGSSGLMIAARHGHKEISELLIAHGAFVNVQDDCGLTALMLAAQRNGFVNICELLLAKDASINMQDLCGENAFMKAAASGNDATCKLLLAKGALIHQADIDGWTALMRAASKGRPETCQLLINEMMKFTNDEVKSIVVLLGSFKMRRSRLLNLAGRDVVPLIVWDLCNKIKAPKRAKAQEEIMKIKNDDRELREELLRYLNTL